jgi:hypothetical protein
MLHFSSSNHFEASATRTFTFVAVMVAVDTAAQARVARVAGIAAGIEAAAVRDMAGIAAGKGIGIDHCRMCSAP